MPPVVPPAMLPVMPPAKPPAGPPPVALLLEPPPRPPAELRPLPPAPPSELRCSRPAAQCRAPTCWLPACAPVHICTICMDCSGHNAWEALLGHGLETTSQSAQPRKYRTRFEIFEFMSSSPCAGGAARGAEVGGCTGTTWPAGGRGSGAGLQVDAEQVSAHFSLPHFSAKSLRATARQC